MTFFLIIFFALPIFNCSSQTEGLPEHVDSISYDQSLDNPHFELCNEGFVHQYFHDDKGMVYKGQKPSIDKYFLSNYRPQTDIKQSGLIRVRFIINCNGQSDRFRLIGMDNNYNPLNFDKKISDQLLELTKKLDGWGIKRLENRPINYYQYLIFKIENGKLIKILP